MTPVRRVLSALILVPLAPSVLLAASLAGQLDGILRRKAFQRVDVEVPLLERTAVRGADFPVSSTTADFVYRLDPEVGVPERVAKSFGPVFLDTADTVGRNAVECGAYLLYSDFSRRDGEKLPGTEPRFSFSASPPLGNEPPIRLPGRLVFEDFDLATQVLGVFGTYGVTERWDVNVVAQAVRTELNATGRTEVNVDRVTVPIERVRIDDAKVGIGDLLLRTKYGFASSEAASFAGGLELRIPTGDTRNFHGVGDLTVTPSVVASRFSGRYGLHANLGVQANTDDLEGSNVRYGTAASVRVWSRLTVIGELLGKSGVSDQTFVADTIARRVGPARRLRQVPVSATIARQDIIDAAIGFKLRLFPTGIAFVSVVLPLTDDGIRADAVPVGGLEWTF